MVRTGYALLLLMMAWSAPAVACDVVKDEGRYEIEHEVFGTIGEEQLTIRCDDDLVIIDRVVDVDVRLMMTSLHKRHAHYTEVWRDDQLVRFEGETDDNGTRTTLTAEVALDGGIAIKGPETPVQAPLTVMPTDPWHQSLIHRTQLFDRMDGHVMNVHVADAGSDRLTIDGHAIDARKFVMSGSREQVFWFDRTSGLWLKSKIRHGTGDITITRQSPPVPARLATVASDRHGG